MRVVTISEFKLNRLALLADMRSSGERLVVTRYGKICGEVGTDGAIRQRTRIFGAFANECSIVGNIISFSCFE
ncbi:MAG TPA: hypothetical protein VK171_01570 [Fimbriimonas sp.]|nr:hypothetical protein [Fimbriimonas sp.]